MNNSITKSDLKEIILSTAIVFGVFGIDLLLLGLGSLKINSDSHTQIGKFNLYMPKTDYKIPATNYSPQNR